MSSEGEYTSSKYLNTPSGGGGGGYHKLKLIMSPGLHTKFDQNFCTVDGILC